MNNFSVSGCGSDFGPFNPPDAYVRIEHSCPRRNVKKIKAIELDLLPIFLPRAYLRTGLKYAFLNCGKSYQEVEIVLFPQSCARNLPLAPHKIKLHFRQGLPCQV
ncbi:unnamed protein product [Strongylus vulgaris]|uniref:Uncharacterized protein n=1 Tax=Strongylus vulgaris TaxID=40348 RepID=A0A3P7IEL4_STRVU|nr:unnamed protein product [Strongylus vulgaris]